LLAAGTLVALALVVVSLATLLRSTETSRAARSRVTPALAILTGGAAVTFAAYVAYRVRCRGIACETRLADGLLGFHHWWRVHDAWQWAGQLMLAALALVVAAAALLLAARDSRRRRTPLRLARLLYGAWAVAVFLPVLYQLVAG
jgi:hypothetical protein